MDVDRTDMVRARAIVLVEGMSDKAALETLARRLGIATGGSSICIVPMGGATNVGRFIKAFGPGGLNLTVTGLCDVGEADHVGRVLAAAGYPIGQSPGDLADAGFYVCDTDLEDELIRAVGVDGVERVIEAQGDIGSYRRFGKEPAQRRRSLEQRLHRFMGTRSGRKSLYASLLADALDLTRIPEPLIQVLTHAAKSGNGTLCQ